MVAVTPACLAAAGAASIAAGATRPLDLGLKSLGFALIGAALFMTAVPAYADQYRQAADNAEVACVVSSRDLTRISLVGDSFASVSKVTTGYPYNDFSVTNEPIRGDIYLSVPEGFAPGQLSFFATSKKGYVYKFACTVGGAEAEQVFVTNPALASEQAREWETKTSPRETAARLIQAMAASATVDGYQLRQVAAPPVRIGSLSVRLIAEYRGAALVGKVLRIDNRGTRPVTVKPSDIAPSGTLALSIGASELAPQAATTLWLVGTQGEGAW
jgi:conjugal transfer pilus assembly protein TraK